MFFFDVLDDKNKTLKMKPIDVTFDSYAECNEDVLKTSCKDVLKTS